MTGPARTAAIERRLERSGAAGPSPDLRRRVLEAVDDVLTERRPAVAGSWASAQGAHGWTWTAAVALVCAAFVVAMSMQAGDVEPISLARRLQAAGVADEAIVAGLVDARPAAAATKPDRRGPEAPTSAALRAIDGIRLLEENL